MSLDAEDLTMITNITKAQNEELLNRLSEKLELTVSPIRENIIRHTAHDEKIHEDMYAKLSKLSNGQSRLLGAVSVVSVVGIALISAVIKGWV